MRHSTDISPTASCALQQRLLPDAISVLGLFSTVSRRLLGRVRVASSVLLCSPNKLAWRVPILHHTSCQHRGNVLLTFLHTRAPAQYIPHHVRVMDGAGTFGLLLLSAYPVHLALGGDEWVDCVSAHQGYASSHFGTPL